MAYRLYLDTARLGLMRRGAQRLYGDFVRFAGEEGCSLYWEEFLREGWKVWPDRLRRRYAGLECWNGVAGLKESVRRLVGSRSESDVLLANRSALLMKLAARLMFRHCRNVLLPDLAWPGYVKWLRRERRRTDQRLTRLRVRRALLKDQMNAGGLVEQFRETFVRFGCDGLFLPAVDHWGIRLPVREIVTAIRDAADVRFVVVDGAQTLAHVPMQFAEGHCDFLIAGCHKWLGAYFPLGLGILGNSQSAYEIKQTGDGLVSRGNVDDPLLQLSRDLEARVTSRYGETVNVAPVLTAQGALRDPNLDCLRCSLANRIANADVLFAQLNREFWTPHLPCPEFRSGIMMIQARGQHRQQSPECVRRQLHETGIAGTCYPGGWIRLSMPETLWTADELGHLSRTLNRLFSI